MGVMSIIEEATFAIQREHGVEVWVFFIAVFKNVKTD